jgi:hypothetical protein
MLLLIQPLFSNQPWKEAYSLLGLFACILLILSIQLLGGYSRYLERSILKKWEITCKAWALSVFVCKRPAITT